MSIVSSLSRFAWNGLSQFSWHVFLFPQSLCVLGSLIAVIAFLGCCGAIVESHCILLIFGIIVTVILALELTIAGLAFAFKADLNTITTRELKEAVSKYNWTDSSATYTVVWNQLQGSLKCCGYNSSSDWKELNPYPLDSNVLPDSCCPRPHVNDSSISHNNVWTIKQSKDSGNCREQSFYADFNRGFSTPSSQQQTGPFKAGCAQHIIDTLFKLIAPLGLTCLAIALFQILGIVFAFSLAKAARQDYQVV